MHAKNYLPASWEGTGPRAPCRSTTATIHVNTAASMTLCGSGLSMHGGRIFLFQEPWSRKRPRNWILEMWRLRTAGSADGRLLCEWIVYELKLSGENAVVDSQTVSDFKKRIPEKVSGNCSQDNFNCDETQLYSRSLPDKTLSVRGQSAKGTRLLKEWVTVVFACSASGSKVLLRRFNLIALALSM